jgi:hypothetical protein
MDFNRQERDRLWKRADEIRTLATRINDSQAREALLILVAEYEQKATAMPFSQDNAAQRASA